MPIKAILAWLAALLVFAALRGGLWAEFGNNPTLAFMLAGSAVLHFARRPSRWEVAVTLALAAVLRWALGGGHYFGAAVIQWGSYLGLASILVLAVQALRMGARARATLLTAAALPFTWILVGFLLGMGMRLIPRTLDPALYAFDAGCGFQPSFVLGRLLRAHGWLREATAIVYYALPFAVSLVLASGRRTTRLVPLYVSMMVAGFCLYFLYPAAGPVYAFPREFPQHAPDAVSTAPMELPGVRRNAMPSLHMAAAILVWWNSRGSALGRLLSLAFLLGTAFATLSTGEHYLVDLVVAFPFVLVFQAMWTPAAAGRRTAIAAGTALTAAWLAWLHAGARWFPLPPVLTWSLLAGTCGLSLWLEARAASVAGHARGRGAPAPVGEPVGPVVLVRLGD